MRIICIAGLIGSGKDTVAEYIAQKYGYTVVDYANILREICRQEGLVLTRDNLQNLRIKYGNTFLAEEAVKRVKESGSKKIILTPIRRSEDFEIPKREFDKSVVMLLVEADARIRFDRLNKRGRENDPKDFDEFARQEKRELEIFNFDKTFAYADFKIKNNRTLKELYGEIDKLIKALKSR